MRAHRRDCEPWSSSSAAPSPQRRCLKQRLEIRALNAFGTCAEPLFSIAAYFKQIVQRRDYVLIVHGKFLFLSHPRRHFAAGDSSGGQCCPALEDQGSKSSRRHTLRLPAVEDRGTPASRGRALNPPWSPGASKGLLLWKSSMPPCRPFRSNKVCICIGLIAKRQAHGRSGLATSAMFFSAKKERAKL